MKKSNKINGIVKLNENLILALVNCQEIMGHDDSIPYQAEVYVMDNSLSSRVPYTYFKIGEVWNDGWGGESEFRKCDELSYISETIEKVNAECSKHNMLYMDKNLGPFDLISVCDVLSEGILSCNNTDKTFRYAFSDEQLSIDNNGHNYFMLQKALYV